MGETITSDFAVGTTNVEIKYDTKTGGTWLFINKGDESIRLYFKNMSRLDTFAARLNIASTELWVLNERRKMIKGEK